MEANLTITTIKWDGVSITKPGIYSGIPLDLYHAVNICDGPSISSSGLRKIFNESPAHFYAEWAGNPDREEQDDADHFSIGRAVHHLMLGEPQFAKFFVIEPDEYEVEIKTKNGLEKTGELKPWSNNAVVCKRWHEAQRTAKRAVLTVDAIHNIKGMCRRLGMNPIVKLGALNGMIEQSIFWKDKQTGIWLKSRPDSIPNDSGDFVDLKTTTSVQWVDLMRAIGSFGYHQQGALVRQAAVEALGLKTASFTLIFVEKKNPWCERIVTLKDEELARGHKQNRVALDQFAECLRTKHWPGPGESADAEPIELFEYDHKRIDDKLAILGVL
jgi:PDDEXK-like domain of unknown function (DUF3799)